MTKVLTDQMKVFINENIDEEKKRKWRKWLWFIL